MSHCIIASPSLLMVFGLQEVAPRPRLETGDPVQGNTGVAAGVQKMQITAGFLQYRPSIYLIHTIKAPVPVLEPYPNIVSSSQLDWSQVCSAEACSPAVVAS